MTQLQSNTVRPKWTTAQIAGGVLISPLVIAAIWATNFADFIPSKLCSVIALIVGITFGLFGGLLAVLPRRLDPAVPPTLTKPRYNFWSEPPAIRFFVGMLIIGILSCVAFQAGFADWYTAIEGHPGLKISRISGWTYGGKHTCGHFEIDEGLHNFRPAFCATYAESQSVPAGAKIEIYGKVSPLGVEVSRWEIPTSQN